MIDLLLDNHADCTVLSEAQRNKTIPVSASEFAKIGEAARERRRGHTLARLAFLEHAPRQVEPAVPAGNARSRLSGAVPSTDATASSRPASIKFRTTWSSVAAPPLAQRPFPDRPLQADDMLRGQAGGRADAAEHVEEPRRLRGFAVAPD
jgi:hypothetical protein